MIFAFVVIIILTSVFGSPSQTTSVFKMTQKEKNNKIFNSCKILASTRTNKWFNCITIIAPHCPCTQQRS
jgi:hypothetical protein